MALSESYLQTIEYRAQDFPESTRWHDYFRDLLAEVRRQRQEIERLVRMVEAEVDQAAALDRLESANKRLRERCTIASGGKGGRGMTRQEIDDELTELAKQDLDAKDRLIALEHAGIEIDLLQRRRCKILDQIMQLLEERRVCPIDVGEGGAEC